MPDAVSRRSLRGNAYARSSEFANDRWNKIDEPGGRKLWFKLVIGLTLLALSGTAFIALGAALFENAWEYHHDGNTGLFMALCVISIVCGTVMFFGSIILGKLIISSKWRTNKKPDYSRHNRAENARVQYTVPVNDDSPAQVQIDLPPPPYEAYRGQGPPPAVYYVSGDHLVTPESPPPPELMLYPPGYSEANDKPPSYSSVNPQPDIHGVNGTEKKHIPGDK